jgi:hypothetical protein
LPVGAVNGKPMPGSDEYYEKSVVQVVRDFSTELATYRTNTEREIQMFSISIRRDLNRAIGAINSHIVSLDRTSTDEAKLRIERQRVLDQRLDNIDRHMRYLFVSVIVLAILSVIFLVLMVILLWPH